MTNTFKYKSILLIDDIDLDNFVSTTIINTYKFAEQVTTMTSADSAIDFLKSISSNEEKIFPQVIFIDINMPLTNGFQFIERLKTELSDELKKHQPKLIMLTSSIFNSDKQKAIDSFEEIIFLVKPLTEENLKTIM